MILNWKPPNDYKDSTIGVCGTVSQLLQFVVRLIRCFVCEAHLQLMIPILYNANVKITSGIRICRLESHLWYLWEQPGVHTKEIKYALRRLHWRDCLILPPYEDRAVKLVIRYQDYTTENTCNTKSTDCSEKNWRYIRYQYSNLQFCYLRQRETIFFLSQMFIPKIYIRSPLTGHITRISHSRELDKCVRSIYKSRKGTPQHNTHAYVEQYPSSIHMLSRSSDHSTIVTYTTENFLNSICCFLLP